MPTNSRTIVLMKRNTRVALKNSQLLSATKILRAYLDRIDRFPKLSQPIPSYREYRAIQRIMNATIAAETPISEAVQRYIDRDCR